LIHTRRSKELATGSKCDGPGTNNPDQDQVQDQDHSLGCVLADGIIFCVEQIIMNWRARHGSGRHCKCHDPQGESRIVNLEGPQVSIDDSNGFQTPRYKPTTHKIGKHGDTHAFVIIEEQKAAIYSIRSSNA
jgi:hypothetical protein